MVIETKRLKIIVLTQEQLEMLVDNIPEFEKRLNCSYQGEKIEGIFKNILYEQSLKIEVDWSKLYDKLKTATQICVKTSGSRF